MFAIIGGWYDCGGIRNWAHNDMLCKLVLSRYFAHSVIGLEDFASWRDSQHPYKRRAVPVTLVETIGQRDLKTWLGFIEPLMLDDQKVVHQGLGWFLREAWNLEPGRVEPFLMKWKNTASRRIYQHAIEKMPLAHRAQFRKSRT
jgi:3-methyladenine DNA glycosylase AlkD